MPSLFDDSYLCCRHVSTWTRGWATEWRVDECKCSVYHSYCRARVTFKIYPEILDFSFHFCLLGEKMLWNTRKCCFLKGRIHNPCMGDKGIFNVNNQGCEKVEIYAQVSEAMTRSLWTQHWTRIYKQQSLGEILTICLRKAFIRQGKTSN